MQFINFDPGDLQSDLYFDQAPVPNPGVEEILVEVRAFGLNRADLLQRLGNYPPPEGASEILGLECSGVVYSVGKGVKKWKEGDEVCGLVDGGAYAEFCRMDESMVWPKQKGMTWVQAAGMPETYLTAYQALFVLMDVTSMDSVLIHAAASGVGTAAIQLMQDLPLQKWGTASGGKISYCLDQGYDKMVDYRSESFRKKITEWSNGKGVDGILDLVGGPYFEDNIWSLARDGKLTILGLMGGVKIKDLNISPILSKRLSIEGSTLRSRTRSYKRRLVAGFLDRFEDQILSGGLKPVIFQTFDWSETQKAHELMASNQNKGKIVLTVS